MIKKQNHPKNLVLLVSALILSVVIGYAYVGQPVLAGQIAERGGFDKNAAFKNSVIKLKTDMGSVPNAVVLHTGDTFKIKWNSKGVSNVKISFLAGGHEFGSIADSVPASHGYYKWTVPDVSDTPGGFGGNFKIAVSDVSNDNIMSISTAFSIMP